MYDRDIGIDTKKGEEKMAEVKLSEPQLRMLTKIFDVDTYYWRNKLVVNGYADQWEVIALPANTYAALVKKGIIEQRVIASTVFPNLKWTEYFFTTLGYELAHKHGILDAAIKEISPEPEEICYGVEVEITKTIEEHDFFLPDDPCGEPATLYITAGTRGEVRATSSNGSCDVRIRTSDMLTDGNTFHFSKDEFRAAHASLS